VSYLVCSRVSVPNHQKSEALANGLAVSGEEGGILLK
jgi:hypothetical protein